MKDGISLYELAGRIRSTLAAGMPETYWVKAELSEARLNASGHFYCNFIEKNAAGQDMASIRGVVWAGTYGTLRQRFERETGQRLAAGIKVLVNVRVSYHERFGMSLVVNDIDPSYTVGDMVRRRQEIVARLKAEGVMEMNRQLPLPRPLLRIAVITSATAAGYGDFRNHLATAGGSFRFVTKLFPATMQGDKTESSIIAALDDIAAEATRWDAVAIIRGGGAVSDLAAFETYGLATNVAQFMLPVITGIGHERDETVIDLVANTRCKTPTAVADFLVARAVGEIEMVDGMAQRLHRSATQAVAELRLRLAAAVSGVAPAFSHRCVMAAQRLDTTAGRLPPAVGGICVREDARRQRLAMRLGMQVARMLETRRLAAERNVERLARGTERMIQQWKTRIDVAGKSVSLAGPERMFRLGFSLTTVNGKAVTDATALREGDEITTRLARGTAVSRVINVKE